MNLEEKDIKGTKIKVGDTVKVYQRAASILPIFKIRKGDKKAYREIYENQYPNKKIEFKLYDGYEYILMVDGVPDAMEVSEMTSEKEVFSMPTERDVAAMNIKRGDQVICIGGEGYARGIFRYNANDLEVILK